MSDMHVREKDTHNKTANCIFHFAVPATQNSIGMDWNEVIQKAKNPSALMADNDSTEKANIEAGSILEVAETVRFSSKNLTDPQRLAEIQAAYSARQSQVFTDLASELDFFGHTIEV